MSVTLAVLILCFLFIVEFMYFKIADHFNIIDKPNARSSHSTITLRGGGIIFCIGVLVFYVLSGLQYHFFILGLFAIGTISFLDDILTLNNKIRLVIHLLCVLLLFYQWELFTLPWYWLIVASIFVIGTINAYNFMDGINGITGGYSLVTIVSLFYINNTLLEFTSNDLLIIIGLSLIVFNFFNFRTKAKCFAGDVGSVSIAFVIIFLTGQLILASQNFNYILLLFIYGLDTVITIVFRLLRKENITQPHRSHFYQYLANEKKWSHLWVATLYALLQLIVNFLLIYYIKNVWSNAIIAMIAFSLLFVCIRFWLEGSKRLLNS